MPIRSQLEISEQMVAQIRLLNKSISAEVGTPERLIIDTVSNAIAEDSIDIIGLQEALNVDTKFGVNLTNFLSIFGFSRQEATKANGFVTFSLNAPSNRTIQVPKGTLVKATEATTPEGAVPEFETTVAAFIRPGETESEAIPIECTRPGAFGNVEANKITAMLSPNIGPLLGISNVTNRAPTSHGADQESDNALKVRFKNTVFRNMAGTEDQYLALSIATTFTTKANVVGPISKYQEYVQVPQNEELGHTLEGDDKSELRFGGEGGAEYAGYPPAYIHRGTLQIGSEILTLPSGTVGIHPKEKIVVYEAGDNPKPIFTSEVKEVLTSETVKMENQSKANITDAWVAIGENPDPSAYSNLWTTGLSTNPFAKQVFPELSVFISTENSQVSKRFFREGADFFFNFPPKLQGDTYRAMIDGTGNDPREGEGAKQPNVTFINVYPGSEPGAVAALAPGSVALLEYSYTSSSSRNSPEHNVTNAIDVFIDGKNEQQTTTLFTPPLNPNEFEFVDEPNSKYYYENYRRTGEPATRPVTGNILTQLFNQPALNIPAQIKIENDVYYRDIHYWLVKDVSGLGGSIRARDGIEWNALLPGDHAGAVGIPTKEEEAARERELHYTGTLFTSQPNKAIIKLENYTYDENIPDLQVAFEGARQVTTDILAHSTRKRYFKLDVSVVYAAKATQSIVNNAIHTAIERFFANQFFGSVIRLSDLITQIHNVSGVENVRWSNDIPHSRDLIRVYETDIEALPLRGIFTERVQTSYGQHPADKLYIVGNPIEGEFGLEYTSAPASTLSVAGLSGKSGAEALEHALNTSPKWLPGTLTAEVKAETRSTVEVNSPIQSFHIVYSKEEKVKEPRTVYNTEFPFQGGEYTYDQDFYLKDDELPALPTGLQEGDTVPGLIIRPRAQNVFEKG